MAQQTKQNTARPALPGILALGTALVLMVALMISLSTGRPAPTEPETTTAPTLAPNPYGPADFTYNEAGYLTCSAGNAVLGIDVSEFQQEID